jgi:ammonium transporter Rh
VVGYVYLSPYLARKIGLDDTCGVHNLHGIPGIIGGLGGAISAATATDTAYGSSISIIFPRRDPNGDNLSASQQAGMQMSALVITLAMAIAGGVVAGYIIKLPYFLPPAKEHPAWCTFGESSSTNYHYDDEHYWETPVPDDDEEALMASERNAYKLEHEMLMINIEKAQARKAQLDEVLGTRADADEANGV